jgi:hypothetical protein
MSKKPASGQGGGLAMSDVVFKYGGPAPTRRCARCAGFELDNAVLRDALLAAWDALEEVYENVPTCPATEKLAIAFRLLAMETAVSASKSFEAEELKDEIEELKSDKKAAEERAERAERERDAMVRDEPGYADLLRRVQAERDAVFRLYDGDEATLKLVREAGVRGDTAPLPRRWAKEIAKAERERDYHMRQYVCAAHVIEDAWAAQGDKARTTGGLADAVATLRRERDEVQDLLTKVNNEMGAQVLDLQNQLDCGSREPACPCAACEEKRLIRERDSLQERAEYAEKALKEKP